MVSLLQSGSARAGLSFFRIMFLSYWVPCPIDQEQNLVQKLHLQSLVLAFSWKSDLCLNLPFSFSFSSFTLSESPLTSGFEIWLGTTTSQFHQLAPCLPSNPWFFWFLPGNYHSIFDVFYMPDHVFMLLVTLSYWILNKPTRWRPLPTCCWWGEGGDAHKHGHTAERDKAGS